MHYLLTGNALRFSHPQEIGFLSPKPVVYVANIPPEAVPSEEDSGETEVDTPEASESAVAIARVALAHADRVADLRREFGVPAVTACLKDREGQETLGAAVRYQLIPYRAVRKTKRRHLDNNPCVHVSSVSI